MHVETDRDHAIIHLHSIAVDDKDGSWYTMRKDQQTEEYSRNS